MKLIDADKLKEVIIEKYKAEFFGSVLWDILNDIPTAYDIDKVVEELEKQQKEAFSYAFKYNDEHFDGQASGLNKAIEIVKQGLKEGLE